jgi:hypothetical protein
VFAQLLADTCWPLDDTHTLLVYLFRVRVCRCARECALLAAYLMPTPHVTEHDEPVGWHEYVVTGTGMYWMTGGCGA